MPANRATPFLAKVGPAIKNDNNPDVNNFMSVYSGFATRQQ